MTKTNSLVTDGGTININSLQIQNIMVQKAKKKEKKLLTEVELELMSILWRLGEGTVKDVLSKLAEGRNLAYTSASTILRILEKKKFIKSRKEGRTHIYIPEYEKSEYEAVSLTHLVKNIFEGSPSSLVARLVDDEKISPQDLKKIKEILDKRINS